MSQSENPSSNQTSESTSLPQPCAGGCGFYGNKDQKNYCSLCYKKLFPEEANMSQSKPTNNNNNNNNDTNSKPIDKGKDNESKEDPSPSTSQKEEDKKPKKKIQKKKNRCWMCRKKVTLAGQFECKCGYVFCSLHRYPDAHQCDFDWKKQHQQKLAKDNKTVAPSKLDKI